ncbi:MAG: aminotransferase class I/II-fold pyridoxal phosphate-dependent enzyme, partial [Myxococcota bacterium]|nr:aminotransferase class I/II-fold pyridoxal phosphate-dependent enzyme [Myxococcota bacterium]
MTRAVILAAGTGSRLREGDDELPKPLRPVLGVALIVRVIRALEASGIREAVIITGHDGERLRRVLSSEPSLGLELKFVHNPRYHQKNGVSLLAARKYIDRECVLTMSDHLYSPDLVRRLLAYDLPEGACGLGVDYDIERCFDLDDATKVRVERAHIAEIGKELDAYNALDTGVFRIGPALLDELARLDAERGDCSLSEGVAALARRGQFFGVDVGDARWIDVDTRPALERAEAMLRVFGDDLGDEPGSAQPTAMNPEALEAFAPSWVRAATPYNESHFALAEKKGAVRMMSNESPFAPSPRVVNAILEAALRGNLYPGGTEELAQKVAEREELETGSVLFGAGSTELIDVVIRTFVAPGEEVLLSVPTFSMYEARTRTHGGIPVLVPMTEDHEHDILALLRAVTERTKVIFLCTPNNPTGGSISEQALSRILGLGLPTVIDEAYVEFGDGDSFAYLIRKFPNAIVLRTFSKAYGLAGLRLGYALAHPVVTRLLSRVKVPWNIPALVIAAASAALDDEAEQSQRLGTLRAAREELREKLGRISGLRPLKSEGNFVLVDVSATELKAETWVSLLLA